MHAGVTQSPLGRATAFGAALGFLRVLPGPVAALAFAGFAAIAHGAEPAESAVAETALVESRRAAAAVWRLSPEDWTRYETLMRGRRGVWTPGADPLLVLGAHARTAAERRRFAEAFVRAEHERVEGELAFERAVQAAWARLFPGELRLVAQSPAEAPPERYALVFERDCTGCEATVRAYAGGAVPVDVYVRGAGDDAALRLWAWSHGVRAADVRAGRVTVNHDDGSVPGPAPAVWARRGGRWAPVE